MEYMRNAGNCQQAMVQTLSLYAGVSYDIHSFSGTLRLGLHPQWHPIPYVVH